jgi:hypothetical protein
MPEIRDVLMRLLCRLQGAEVSKEFASSKKKAAGAAFFFSL